MGLQEWLEANSLQGVIDSGYLKLDDKVYFIFEPQEDTPLLTFQFEFNLPIEWEEDIELVFPFGKNWYYSERNKPQFNILKYIGISKEEFDFPYLGVHGKCEFCNGSREYTDWVNKARFLGIKTLGICEQDTLAGALQFQTACHDAGIKSIIGETVTVKNKDEERYKIKLYCQDDIGWKNLLNINAQIKVFNDGFVDEKYVLEHSKGLVCVIDSSTKLHPVLNKVYLRCFVEDLYYQFDPVEWLNEGKEEGHLNQLKEYVDKYMEIIPPIVICDSYYLDKEESHIKKLLNTVGKIGFQNQSHDQYFKSFTNIFNECDELFKDDEKADIFLSWSNDNLKAFTDNCTFEIKLKELHLPEYKLTGEEAKKYKDAEDLFVGLITKGFEKKIQGNVEDEDLYWDRVDKEVDVIRKGGLTSYFLIIWDIINWCAKNDILTSIGRGSAAGSLVSYLLGITKLDPIKYNLLFERFLSEARIGTSMPDIDNDVQSDRRDDVKRYIEQRYGVDYVMGIASNGTFKIKSCIKDIGKYYNVDYEKTNFVTSTIPRGEDFDSLDFTDTFKYAFSQRRVSEDKIIASPLEKFLQQHPQVIEDFQLISGGNAWRTFSIHPAGIVILPKHYKGELRTVYDWLPVKKMDGVLISEWDMDDLDVTGYLKADILGVTQLQKFAETIKLIKKNHGIDISFEDMDLEDPKVYELFQQGLNEDVFQFGASGLKAYCKNLKPVHIEDLVATIALYRPGPIGSGTHNKFVKIRNGNEQPEYDYMLEEVTKNTYGLYAYQEQVMQAVHILGGLTLVEAEDVRKAMGKKIQSKMDKYKQQFLRGAIENKCSVNEAEAIWNKLAQFGAYGFNRSHAAAYAHIGYFAQWLKHRYPIEFWSVSLQHAATEEVSQLISEIYKITDIKVLPPDINQSTESFTVDFKQQLIFWSLSSIKQMGDVTMKAFMEERNKNGKYFSFEEFCQRIKKKVDKRIKLNLILSGCFDRIEKIKSPSDRIFVVKKLYNILDEEVPEEFKNSTLVSKDDYWGLKQRGLTGFGFFDYEKIYKSLALSVKNLRYLDPKLLQTEEYIEIAKQDPYGSTGPLFGAIGILTSIIERKSRKTNKPFGIGIINHNAENFKCLIWEGIWEKWKPILLASTDKVIFITGRLKYDGKFNNENQIQTVEQTQIKIL